MIRRSARRGLRAVLLFLLVVAPPAAWADDLDALKQLHQAGAYLEAAALGERLGTAEALALAANALAVRGYYELPAGQQEPPFREAVRLVELAKQAAAGSTDNGLLGLIAFQEGQAQGRLAEVLPLDERRAYADPVREAFERSIALWPESWQAHVGLARWHAQAEVTADHEAGLFGSLFVGVIYGASMADAEKHRAAAAAIAKDSDPQKIFLTESSEIRLLIDPKANLEAARGDLEASLAIAPQGHLAKLIHERAAACLADVALCAERLHDRVLEE